MPSGPPRWSSTIVTSSWCAGPARPPRGAAGGTATRRSSARPGRSAAMPLRNAGSPISPGAGSVCERRTSGLASQAVTWRMPRNRPPPASTWAASTSSISGAVRSAKPTMPRMKPSGSAATTNSVSPTGRKATGPSSRYADAHSRNTVPATPGTEPTSARRSSVMYGLVGCSHRWWWGSMMGWPVGSELTGPLFPPASAGVASWA